MKKRNVKGSITVEAAVIVPIFICVIMSITLFIRVVYIHGLVQHAINETAQELSTYSYIYSVSGLQGLHNKANEELRENKEILDGYIKETAEAYAAMNTLQREAKEAFGTVNLGDISSVKEKLDSLKASADTSREELLNVSRMLNDIGQDPQKALISMAYFLANGSFETIKTKYVCEPLTRAFAQKYFADDGMDAQERLLGLNVINGFNGLDFSQSKLFEDNQTIDIVVRYKIKNIMPIKIIPDISLIQRSVVRAWLDGHVNFKESGSDINPDNENANVWDLPPIQRGIKIQQIFGRNLPVKFPVIAKLEQGNAEMIKSMDLEDITYQKPGNVKSKVNSFIKELTEFKGAKYQETEVEQKDITNKKLIIVVPQGTIRPEIQKVFDECIKKAGQDVQVEIREFGKKSDKKEEGE